ncbi:MAG: hypothetical protein Q4A72_03040 [Bacillota bacterium]|nr:hypothetical protein [Bacillota bacterium]
MLKNHFLLNQTKREGASLLVIIIIMIVISLFIAGMLLLFENNTRSVATNTESKRMYYYARTGMNIAEAAVNEPTNRIYNALQADPSIILTDTIDRSKLQADSSYSSSSAILDNELLPEKLKIHLMVEFITNSKAISMSKPDLVDYLMITSEAEWDSGSRIQTYKLVKYIDPEGVNSFYE